MVTIAIASGNKHKLEEISAILAPFKINCLSLDNWPWITDLPETADTFEENAIMKAQELFRLTGVASVADDSGLEVDALKGAPGVYSKRFTPEATSKANNKRLLKELTGIHNRKARFKCVIALVGAKGIVTATGVCEGKIGHSLIGKGGFGYDPLFLPNEANGRTMAELTADEKNAISHRGKAFSMLPRLIRDLGL